MDGSAALAWALPDESSRAAEGLLERLSPGDVFWVPALWWYEIANALLSAERRGRLPEAAALRAFEFYGRLPLRVDEVPDAVSAARCHALAREHRLSAYDASYLELAGRRGIALASLDKRLRFAAGKAGVEIRH